MKRVLVNIGTLAILLSLILITTYVPESTSIENRNDRGNEIVWKTNTTHYINGRFTVEHDETLVIEPGAKVCFGYDGPGCLNPNELYIEGKLTARGTWNKRILFTSNRSSPAAGDWGKITFSKNADPESTVEFSKVEYCNTGIHLNLVNITICHNIFENVHRFGIKCQASSPRIYNNTISTLDTGIRCMDCKLLRPSCPVIENNTIEDNLHYGIYMDALSAPVVENNIIRNNGDFGIYSIMSAPEIGNNIIENGKYGIGLLQTGAAITGNDISDCTIAGVSLNFCENVTVLENTFTDNGVGLECNETRCSISNNTFEGDQPVSMEMIECDPELEGNERNGNVNYLERIAIKLTNADGYPVLGTELTIYDGEDNWIIQRYLGNESSLDLQLLNCSMDTGGEKNVFTPYRVLMKKNGVVSENHMIDISNEFQILVMNRSGTPILTIGPMDDIVHGTEITISGELHWGDVDPDGISYKIMIRIDGGEWQDTVGRARWAHVCDTLGMGKGLHKVEVRLDDGIGNPVAKSSFAVVSDETGNEGDYLVQSIVAALVLISVVLLDSYRSGKR